MKRRADQGSSVGFDLGAGDLNDLINRELLAFLESLM